VARNATVVRHSGQTLLHRYNSFAVYWCFVQHRQLRPPHSRHQRQPSPPFPRAATNSLHGCRRNSVLPTVADLLKVFLPAMTDTRKKVIADYIHAHNLEKVAIDMLRDEDGRQSLPAMEVLTRDTIDKSTSHHGFPVEFRMTLEYTYIPYIGINCSI